MSKNLNPNSITLTYNNMLPINLISTTSLSLQIMIEKAFKLI